MADAALAFLAAARACRAAYAAHEPDPFAARRLRNAVARVYLAAVFLPSHTSTADAGPAPAAPADPLAALDDALAHAIALLEADGAGAVWEVRRDFEEGWGAQALDVLRPLHELARSPVA